LREAVAIRLEAVLLDAALGLRVVDCHRAVLGGGRRVDADALGGVYIVVPVPGVGTAGGGRRGRGGALQPLEAIARLLVGEGALAARQVRGVGGLGVAAGNGAVAPAVVVAGGGADGVPAVGELTLLLGVGGGIVGFPVAEDLEGRCLGRRGGGQEDRNLRELHLGLLISVV